VRRHQAERANRPAEPSSHVPDSIHEGLAVDVVEEDGSIVDPVCRYVEDPVGCVVAWGAHRTTVPAKRRRR
jgi:hypothetical protein